jgi:hypothetical protein
MIGYEREGRSKNLVRRLVRERFVTRMGAVRKRTAMTTTAYDNIGILYITKSRTNDMNWNWKLAIACLSTIES